MCIYRAVLLFTVFGVVDPGGFNWSTLVHCVCCGSLSVMGCNRRIKIVCIYTCEYEEAVKFIHTLLIFMYGEHATC